HRPQPGDVVLNRVPRRGGQLLAPESVDERVDRGDTPLAQREQGHERPALRPDDVHGSSAGDDLERPEQADLEPEIPGVGAVDITHLRLPTRQWPGALNVTAVAFGFVEGHVGS